MITRDEAITAHYFHEYDPTTNCCYNWRRNGQTKTWKRDPQRIHVPVKFGLRHYYAFGYSDLLNPNLHVAGNCPYATSANSIPIPE